MPVATISDVPAFSPNDLAFDAVTETVFRSVHGTELWREQFSKFYAPVDELLHDLQPLRVRGVVIMGRRAAQRSPTPRHA